MNKARILDYLYGEMSAVEQKNFEAQLQQDSVLRKEVEELRQVRTFLAGSVDEVPEPITLMINTPPKVKKLSRWWAIAASLLILVVGAKLLNFRVESNASHLVMGFGPMNLAQPTTSPDLQKQYVQLEKAINKLQTQLTGYDLIPPDNETVQPVTLSENQKLAGWIVKTIREEQSGLENRLANKILEDQQMYIQGVAQDMMQYWNEQRKTDMQAINNGMQQLVQLLQLPPQDLAQFVNNTQQNY